MTYTLDDIKALLLEAKKNRVIVAGSRGFTDFGLLCDELDLFLVEQGLPTTETTIVSGTAKGADLLGEKYAMDLGMKLARFAPNWGLHGKKAGPIRNVEMAEYATHCIVFWDGKSRGSKHMIDTAQAKGLPTKIIRY